MTTPRVQGVEGDLWNYDRDPTIEPKERFARLGRFIRDQPVLWG